MFHQSMSRSQRAKGSKARRTVQVTVLLAVVVWLLYQAKHSYDKKTEVAENNYNKLATGVVDIYFGRKANAGSQNENSIDVHRDNSHGTTEMMENGVDGDAWNREVTTEVENESEESQQGITNGNVDDNVEVNTEDAHESLRLPSQMESDNLDHNEIKNDSDSSSEQNEFPKEGATENGDVEFTTSNEASMTEDGRHVSQGSEHDETGGENSDKAEPVTEESTDTSVSDDRRNTFVSGDKDTIHEGETIEAQEHTQSDTENASSNTEEDAATNARSDAEVVNENVNLPNSTDENNVASEDSQTEVGSQMGNSMDATSAEASSEDGNSNSVMQDRNGSPGSEEGESQVDVNSESESQATGNNYVEAVTDEKNSEVENGNLSNSTEENSSHVLSDNNGAPKDEEIQSQMDISSEDAKTDTTPDDDQSKADVFPEVATGDTVKKENYSKSSDVAVEEVQSQENNNQDSIEEKSDDVVSSSAQNNEQNDSEMQNNEETPKEEVASDGDNALKAETTGNIKDAVTEPVSKEIELSYVNRTDPIPSDLGSDIENGQKGNTGSETSLSGSEEDLKKSVEL